MPFLGPIELAEFSNRNDQKLAGRTACVGAVGGPGREGLQVVRAISNTGVDDGRIKRNPCRLKGAGEYRSAERTTATVPQVYALTERMPDRFRAVVLSAAFTGLRWGELIALRRCDIDLTQRALYVRRRRAQLSRGGM